MRRCGFAHLAIKTTTAGTKQTGLSTQPVVARGEISGYPRSMAKVLVSIDDRLLARIDRAARASGLTRSAYLSGLAARDVGSAVGPGRERKVRRALRRLDKLFHGRSTREDATAAIRAERDAR